MLICELHEYKVFCVCIDLSCKGVTLRLSNKRFLVPFGLVT